MYSISNPSVFIVGSDKDTVYGRNRNGGLRGDEVHSERLERGTTLFGWVGDHFQEGVVARTERVGVWSEETSRRRVGDSTGNQS